VTDARSSAAPERLEAVRAFVNTLDIEDTVDALETPADVVQWLRDQGLLDREVRATSSDRSRAVALREALRAAMASNHDDAPIAPDAVAVLSAAAERAGLTLSMTPDGGWVASPRAHGVDGALGALLVIVSEAMTDGSWRRLKVCANDTCQWAFYDLSRARSGRWCTMQVCGNRAKQRAWRARRDP
jgi:predicted RNA-binding Zn ribbon-like protein